ncbi:VOC family protein [Nocardioides seonyuensis]|uniref:VOC family protein n=1 Tax=Nocardioides seonyuensis TaxID=2518371 RepID=A0A4P7IBP9_9ACTN|nr:VOC family protein [Nocardioides seonyuensis]QBX54469.1 VOC family protein [Nocardioides seonyuensis]
MNATKSLTLINSFVRTTDPDASLAFYRDVLGMTVNKDVRNGDFRWVTLSTPTQPELEVCLEQIGQGADWMSDDDVESMKDLLAKGLLNSLVFQVDDVDALFEHVRASGAEVMQEPADQFYGVRDCAFRDPMGNMVRFNSPLADGAGQG